jgi:hypothetical protein
MFMSFPPVFPHNTFVKKVKAMHGFKLRVIQWIQSGRDYNKGIGLLFEITGDKNSVHAFSGKEHAKAGKLAYEVCKAAKLADTRTWKDFVRRHAGTCEAGLTAPDDLSAVIDSPDEQITLEDPPSEYPPMIRQIVHEYASLFQERSRLHLVMTGLPESNADTVRLKRAELFDMVKSLSARLEVLHEARSLYDTQGVLPDENRLFPSREEPKNTDLNSMDEETLKKRKKNLQNGNSKDQFLLDYQSQESKTVKNPMPPGPKRTKIEYRINQRIKQIGEIEKALLRHVIKK